MLAFLARRDCLVSSDGVRQLIDLHLPYRDLEHAKVPVHVVATDLLSGESVVLSKGSASQAILASTAIPFAFPPVLLERRYLADGAVTCNTPVMVAVELGARGLVVLPTGYACALETPPRGAIACALHSLTLLIARQLLHELSSLTPEIDFCIVPPLCPVRNSPYDFAMTGELIERAAESTNAWIAGGGLTRREIVHHMHKHMHA